MTVRRGLWSALIVLGSLLAGPPAAATGWQIVDVAAQAPPSGGFAPAILDVDGNPNLWWFQAGPAPEGSDTLWHASWDGRAWRSEALIGNSSRQAPFIGRYPSALEYQGQPNLFYGRATFQPTGLEHAWRDGTTWRFETLPGGTNWVAPVVDHGVLHVFWNDDNGRLGQTWRAGGGWRSVVLDGAGGPDGRIRATVGASARVIMTGGTAHVFYYDATHGNLRQAWYSAGRWHFSTVDGAGGGGGRVSADVGAEIAVNNDGGYPHVFYRGAPGLRQAWFDPRTWQWRFSVVDREAGSPSTTMSGTTPWVFYSGRAGLQAVRFDRASWRWVRSVVDAGSRGSSAAVSAPDGLFVAYSVALPVALRAARLS